MGILIPNVKARFFDANGSPLAGGKLYTYLAGTSTPLATYSDNEVTPNTNPVILDSEGRADIWLASSSTYKFVLKDSDDNLIWTVDNISGSGGGGGGSSSGGWSAYASHSVTDGQSATDLSGETVDGATYSSAIYEYEIQRGTTVFANGKIYLQYLNSTWRLVDGGYASNESHGVTFSITTTGTTVQLQAALDTGAGDGTIKLSKRLIS